MMHVQIYSTSRNHHPLAVSAPGLASANNIVGVAEIIDGDSFSVGGAEVRLFGVDAPEYDQTCFSDGSSITCGALAKEALEGLVGSETLACVPLDTDTFGRAVARSTSGVDVGEALARSGWATAFRRNSDEYVGVEGSARLVLECGNGSFRPQRSFGLPKILHQSRHVHLDLQTERHRHLADWNGMARA
jgi:endonuclease YncB( thermonuclease family)